MESKWYTVKVQSNRERVVSDRIKLEMNRKEKEVNVLVPVEKVYFAKNGKKANREKIIYPGYVFVETKNLEVLQDALKFIPGNSGILKSKVTGQPSFLKKEEIDKMLDQVTRSNNDDVDIFNFVIGEEVKIIGGPFDSFKGTITEVSKEKNKAKLEVLIFGRPTPVDIQFDQLEKII